MKSDRSYVILAILLSVVSLTSFGCQHAISKDLRLQAVPAVAFEALRADPDAFKGRTVILGGDILKTENTPQQTSIEILQKPLDRFESPHITDQTAGRFIARCEQYLDPAIYDKGRQITVAGTVLGRYEGQVGEAAYLYPLISCSELHLWPLVSHDTVYPVYPHPWLWHPYRPWYFPYDYYYWPRYYRSRRYR